MKMNTKKRSKSGSERAKCEVEVARKDVPRLGAADYFVKAVRTPLVEEVVAKPPRWVGRGLRSAP